MSEPPIHSGPIPCLPQLRVYLTSLQPPPVAAIFSALRDYDVFPQRQATELYLEQKMTLDGEPAFRAECLRLATLIAPLLRHDTWLNCHYDAQPYVESPIVRFTLTLVKAGDQAQFLEEIHRSFPEKEK